MIAQFSAAHPLLTTLAIVGICWCTASLLLCGIWIACFPAIRIVPTQAPGRASDRKKES